MNDPVQLSAHALQALQQFYDEQAGEAERFAEMQRAAEETFEAGRAAAPAVSMDVFREDWQLSQFWYSDETAERLAREIARVADAHAAAGKPFAAACISAPSAFVKLKQLRPDVNAFLLEFDRRFACFGSDFRAYDYRQPEQLEALPANVASARAVAADLAGSIDVILADPPFLSAECWEKTSATVRRLARPGAAAGSLGARVIVCTGAVMQSDISRLIPGFSSGDSEVGTVEVCGFEPEHRNGLQNQFRCLVNYAGSSLERA